MLYLVLFLLVALVLTLRRVESAFRLLAQYHAGVSFGRDRSVFTPSSNLWRGAFCQLLANYFVLILLQAYMNHKVEEARVLAQQKQEGRQLKKQVQKVNLFCFHTFSCQWYLVQARESKVMDATQRTTEDRLRNVCFLFLGIRTKFRQVYSKSAAGFWRSRKKPLWSACGILCIA